MGCLFQMTSSFEADPRIGSGLVDLVVAHIVGLFDGVVDRVFAHIVGLFDGLFNCRSRLHIPLSRILHGFLPALLRLRLIVGLRRLRQIFGLLPLRVIVGLLLLRHAEPPL